MEEFAGVVLLPVIIKLGQGAGQMANSNRAAIRRVQHVAQSAFSAVSLILQLVLRCHVIAVLTSVFMCAGIAHAAGANYVYDELGRLVQVIAGDGSSTQYAY
ncbi:RHS repeat domain-containing protein, partial [Collimonas sp.]|uniref:RHS repeat domain-containing protein n=1 Tax=Collimonas sp. TaxID=1963772 RepID=UPI002BA08868